MKRTTLQMDDWADLLYLVKLAAEKDSSVNYLLEKLLNSDIIYIDRPVAGSENDDYYAE